MSGTALAIEVELDPPYDVTIGRGVLARLSAAVPGRRALAADAHVMQHHSARVAGLQARPVIALPRGEAAKTWATLESITSALAREAHDRTSTLVVLGGGATCDVGGLAAALYMRGIDAVYCPTTLLAMVDAAVGGKTAINLPAGKNLVGTFHQPRAVFADVEVLATLDDVELRSGLGEVVKSAMIAGEELFSLVERSAEALSARDPDVLTDVIAACVRTKARIVASDEHERGPRRQLNLGHTFAHAIECVAGYGAIPHGAAVACGLALALRASAASGRLVDRELPERLDALLARLRLPRSLSELRREHRLPAAALVDAMRLDKKSRAGELRLVLPRALGEIETDLVVELERLSDALG